MWVALSIELSCSHPSDLVYEVMSRLRPPHVYACWNVYMYLCIVIVVEHLYSAVVVFPKKLTEVSVLFRSLLRQLYMVHACSICLISD